jgi:hypothetical protein
MLDLFVQNSLEKAPLLWSALCTFCLARLDFICERFCCFLCISLTFFRYGNNAQAVISCIIHGGLGDAVKGLLSKKKKKRSSLCFVAVALVLQLTFALPLNTHPIWTTIEPFLQSKLSAKRFSDRAIYWFVNLQRAALVCLFGVLAFAIPYFGDFSNLVGAIATSFVTWILPPAIQIKSHGRSLAMTPFCLNVACITFGFAVMIASSSVTVINLIDVIKNPPIKLPC